MAGTIRAGVKVGLLEPLETLNLPEGKEVTVTILDVPSARDAHYTSCAGALGSRRGSVTRRCGAGRSSAQPSSGARSPRRSG